MASLNKRPATYVPVEARRELDRLSKADLMEILWDLAAIATGYADSAHDDPTAALEIIVGSHSALRHNGYQGSVKLAGAD